LLSALVAASGSFNAAMTAAATKVM